MKKESASASTFFTIKNNNSIGYFNGNQNFRKIILRNITENLVQQNQNLSRELVSIFICNLFTRKLISFKKQFSILYSQSVLILIAFFIDKISAHSAHFKAIVHKST